MTAMYVDVNVTNQGIKDLCCVNAQDQTKQNTVTLHSTVVVQYRHSCDCEHASLTSLSNCE